LIFKSDSGTFAGTVAFLRVNQEGSAKAMGVVVVIAYHRWVLVIVVGDVTASGMSDVPGASAFATFRAVVPGAIVEFASFIRVMRFLVDPSGEVASSVIVVAIVVAISPIIAQRPSG